MDNHPIPQDITGFQFKLIGNMTIKQFVYLAIGAVLAWLFFFIIDFPTIIKWPLSIFAISAGAIFAFVPVDGRPMDTMLSNFIRALVSPTQFIYEKEGMKVEPATLPKSQPLNLPNLQKAAPVSGTMVNPLPPIPVQEPIQQQVQAPVAQMPASPQIRPVTPPVIQQVASPAPQISFSPTIGQNTYPAMPAQIISQTDDSSDLKQKNEELEELKNSNKKLEEELEKLKKQFEDAMKAKEDALKEEAAPPPPPATAEPTPDQKELEKQLIEANRQREALQRELLTQQAKANSPTQGVTPTTATPTQPSQRVRSVPPGMEQSVGIPSVPEAPNLITGIVKDPRGNPLQNILIEVKDQDSNPVRAFKTNGLGKFASATSLSNGKYLITFEDPKETNKFDAVEIELVGAPVMPLEIFSVDPREELRRELFK